MSDFNPRTLLPCPPDIADYTFLAGGEPGNWGVVPVECQLNKLYSTDYILNVHSGAVGAVFKCQLESGKTYRIGVETSETQVAFSEDTASLYYWKPSEWLGGSISPYSYSDLNNEDVGPFWCPYSGKLNSPLFYEGRRYEFVPDETGFHVFMFKKYTGPH